MKKEKTILTVNGKNIPTGEFKYAYEKNRKVDSNYYNKESLNTYMDLFVKFKLKIAYAEEMGMDTTPAFINEINKYKKQLAKPFLDGGPFIDSLAAEAYERSKTDLRASHILISFPNNYTPKDTVERLQLISAIRDSIITKQITFQEAAIKYSQDPSAKNNLGDLGYFSAFKMVYPFENAAFNTPLGEVSEIVRTSFGYHIIHVKGKRNSPGTYHVKQIMISQGDDKENKEKADLVYKKILNGEPWNELSNEFNDHQSSKKYYGKIIPFTSGELGLPSFEEAAFTLKKPGEFTKPVKSRLGYHVIQLIKIDELKPYKEVKNKLIGKVKKSDRAAVAKQSLINQLKKTNKLKETSILEKEQFYADIDSIITTKGSWDYKTKSPLANETLFKMKDTTYAVSSFYEHIRKTHWNVLKSELKKSVAEKYNLYKEEQIISYEVQQLPNKFPDYKRVVNEYKEGIMLFDLMNKNVWRKASKDTAGLRKFYNANVANYQYNDRIATITCTAQDSMVIEKIKEIYAANKTDLEAFKKQALEKYPASLKLQSKVYEKGVGNLSKLLDFTTETQTVKYRGDYKYVITTNTLPKDTKPFKSIKGIVITDYQKKVEEQWIEELRNKYTVEINEKELERITKK